MAVTAILGEQRGDEGKGRYVDMYMEDYDIGARFGGGNNAGHTIVKDGVKFKVHGLPTSVVHEHAVSVMGNGVVVNPVWLVNKEMHKLASQGIEITPDNLLIGYGAHLVLPHLIYEDKINEIGPNALGSTKSGIAPTYAAKAYHTGIRMDYILQNVQSIDEFVYSSLVKQRSARSEAGLDPINEKDETAEFMEAAIRIGKFAADVSLFLNRELRKDTPARVLAEGAQAFWLDTDHGMYPFVTSSNTTAGGIINGLGIPNEFVTHIIGVSKLIQSHVGGGPFVTEITEQDNPELLQRLHGDMNAVDAERGTTTGRTRRLGYYDLPQIRRAQQINGTHEMALTKFDWLPRFQDEFMICTSYTYKGEIHQRAPCSAYELEQCEPIYKPMPVWDESIDISSARAFNDLPKEGRDIIETIEEETGVPITMIGIGPDRDQVIAR